uniref:Leucine rich immune protein (Coil-less) n=1 Tax=Anopheles minimus TaxID=112268 RepID=A0A182WJA4_9DIPT
MEAKRGCMIPLLICTVILYLWIHGPPIVHSTTQPCAQEDANCVYDTLNIATDGLQRLRARESREQFQITVQRLITPYPDGVLLQLLSEFVLEVDYEQYHDRVLRIPPNAMLTDLSIKNAPELSKIVVSAPNNHLVSLEIQRSGLRSVPHAFRNLPQLQYLDLEYSSLETLSLDPFASTSKITNIGCSSNKIRQLVASRNLSLVVPVVDLLLSYNLLESLDGEFFRPLQMLKFITFDGNRIQRFEGVPVSLPQIRYFSMVQNRLSQLDVSRWNVPQLLEIYLEGNNLTRIPAGIERLPALASLLLQSNLLTVVDLRRLDGCITLEKIDLSDNRLRSVITSGTGNLSLPNMLIVNLSYNRLTNVDCTRWDFPQLTTFAIAFNQFQQLPDVFQLFPNMRRVVAFQNPLHCSVIRRLQQHIDSYKLSVDTSNFGMACTTNSTVNLPSGRELCCVE